MSHTIIRGKPKMVGAVRNDPILYSKFNEASSINVGAILFSVKIRAYDAISNYICFGHILNHFDLNVLNLFLSVKKMEV